MKKIITPWQSLLLLMILVIAASCQKQNAVSIKKERYFELSGFTKITAGENFTVNMIMAKSFSIKAIGSMDDLLDLGLKVEEGQLNIKYNRIRLAREKIEFVITVPVIDKFQLYAAAKGSITGFQDQSSIMNTVLTGYSNASLSGAGMQVNINVSGNSVLSLSGNTESLNGSLSGSGQLHAYGLNAREVKVNAAENGKAYIMPTNILFANVSGNGQVFYKGDPSIHVEINDNGQVVQE